jgi:integrase
MLAAVNRFLKEMGKYDCMVKQVRIQRQTFRSQEQELTKAEYVRLLHAARQRGDIRLYLLMQTVCSTGIRISELRFITVDAVRQGRATVTLKGKSRQVLLPTALIKELINYINVREIQSGSIFVTKTGRPMDRSNILHSMKKLCPVAQVDPRKVYLHNLRHLFACQYYKAEKNLSNLADLLGHSSVNTTRIYTSTSGMEHQRQIDRLGLVL